MEIFNALFSCMLHPFILTTTTQTDTEVINISTRKSSLASRPWSHIFWSTILYHACFLIFCPLFTLCIESWLHLLCFSDKRVSYIGCNQWRTWGGVKHTHTHTHTPEIPKALQNRAKLNPIVKTVKNCWIYDANTPRCSEIRQ